MQNLISYYVDLVIFSAERLLFISTRLCPHGKSATACRTFTYIIALGSMSSLENANSFLPRSLSEAPMW